MATVERFPGRARGQVARRTSRPPQWAAAGVVTVFGTRPEVIKLAPVIRALENGGQFRTVNVCSSQHTDLLVPLISRFGIRIDHDLKVMVPNQTPSGVCARVIALLDPILTREQPDVLMVQGDTTTALAAALAAFYRGVPVAHVEAGLRSGNLFSPFPEEMNRRVITQLATWHFAATERNRNTLLAEGVAQERIFVTGNPVVDALHSVLDHTPISSALHQTLQQTAGLKRIVLTTHRRESFGEVMSRNLNVLADFVRDKADVALLFPVHPNPAVVEAARRSFRGCDRTYLLEPLGYEEFIYLLSQSWLIVSDSGGVQEEVATLGKPLLVLRENTERPEAVECQVARLSGGDPERLALLLQQTYGDQSWQEQVKHAINPFGKGDAGPRIASILAELHRPQFLTSIAQ